MGLFAKSKFVKDLLTEGKLPEVKTDSEVKATIDDKSLKHIGILALVVGVGITLLIITVKLVSKAIK